MCLIINADDFALTAEVNHSILSLYKLGIVSSTTVLCNGRYFDMAVEISKDNPKLGVGVHLSLDGPYNLGKEYTTLLDPTMSSFYNLNEAVSRIRNQKFNEEEVYREYCLQIEKVFDNGIHISHLDHHHHLHLYLPVLRPMIRAAKRYNIPFIRPQKMILPRNSTLLKDIYRDLHHLYLKNHIRTISGYFESEIKCDADIATILSRLKRLVKRRNLVTEVVVHPSALEGDLVYNTYSGEEVRRILDGTSIISYNDLK